ncbi:MAG: hypothetical protein QG670_2651 [Thermoproteota archaeon]|nr:hypothetical protein [Thermoproteota archaeon]
MATKKRQQSTESYKVVFSRRLDDNTSVRVNADVNKRTIKRKANESLELLDIIEAQYYNADIEIVVPKDVKRLWV